MVLESIFRTKVRRIGTSLGILIPKGYLQSKNISEGQEVEVGLLKKKSLQEVLRLFGAVRGTRPFVRDRTDRAERY